MLEWEPTKRKDINRLVSEVISLYEKNVKFLSLKNRPFFSPKKNDFIDMIYYNILKRIENKIKLKIHIKKEEKEKIIFFLNNINNNENPNYNRTKEITPHLTELNKGNIKLTIVKKNKIQFLRK